jgi:hypothetical protein
MRNSIDQDDEQTNGVNKRTLLSGDQARPQPEPGSLKSEQEPKDPAERRMKAATDYMRAAADFMQARQRPVEPAPQVQQQAAPAAPPAPRSTVEMYEGAKKRNVDFP